MNREQKNRKARIAFAGRGGDRPPNREQGAWICYQLKLRGVTQKEVAAAAGVGSQMVQRVSYGIKTSARVQKALARALGFDTWNELLAARRGVAA